MHEFTSFEILSYQGRRASVEFGERGLEEEEPNGGSPPCRDSYLYCMYIL